VSTIARVQKVVSDLSGAEVEENDAVQLIVRKGPGIDRPLVIDALPSEVGDLGDAPDVYQVEIKPYSGEPARELLCTVKDLKKLVQDGNLDQLFENARGTRGRPPLLRRT
jgi:hypothetical protein